MYSNFNVSKDLMPSDPRFGCGPSIIPSEHIDNLVKNADLLGTSHRESRVKKLVEEIIENCKSYFQLPSDYTVVLGNGGASLLFDAISLNAITKRSLHYTCGEFSHKWYVAASAVPTVLANEMASPLGEGLVVKDGDADLIASILNETSTGVMIKDFPKCRGLLAIDATSGAGQISCDMANVDIYFFSLQKVFASEGGLFVAFMSPRAVERIFTIVDSKSRYIPEFLNLKVAINNSLKNQTYNTPSISTLFLFNQTLIDLNKLGQAKVEEMARAKADLLYSWANDKSYLSCFVQEEKFRSISVATIDVDAQYPIDSLLKRLNELGVAYGINSYRKLARNQFRIAMFHYIKYEDLQKLIHILSKAIESSI